MQVVPGGAQHVAVEAGGRKMTEWEVRIVRLEPMRVASVHGFGEQPEYAAWDKLIAWAGPQGLLKHPEQPRIFGFNNPDPSPGSPNYGYEFWIAVGPDVEAGGEAQIKEFSGGLYAVTRCRGPHTITETWQKLATWCEDSKYEYGHHQWLEEHLGPVDTPHNDEEMVLDLYLPIAE